MNLSRTAVLLLCLPSLLLAQLSDVEEVARELSNPLGRKARLSLRNDLDLGGGPEGDGYRYRLDIEPLMPHAVSEAWDLIHQISFPLLDQEDQFAAEAGGQSGIGDTVYRQWLSPVEPTANGLVWGGGLAWLIPTANDDLLGRDQWGLGPSAALWNEVDDWYYGLVWNHIWKIAGESDRSAVNNTYFRPFVERSFLLGTTVTLDAEFDYDWSGSELSLPMNLMYNQVFEIWEQMMQWQLGARYYLASADNDPDWGLSFSLTFAYP